MAQRFEHAFSRFLTAKRHIPRVMKITDGMEIVVSQPPDALACRQRRVPDVGGQVSGAGKHVAVDDFDARIALQVPRVVACPVS